MTTLLRIKHHHARNIDLGLLLLRVGFGALFIAHGLPKLLGGPERWEQVGGVMALFGLEAWPELWGLLAACAETLGGLLLIVGFLTRFASLTMLLVMIVATTMHLTMGDPFAQYSHPLKAAVVFASFLLLGPGRYSIDGRRAASHDEDDDAHDPTVVRDARTTSRKGARREDPVLVE